MKNSLTNILLLSVLSIILVVSLAGCSAETTKPATVPATSNNPVTTTATIVQPTSNPPTTTTAAAMTAAAASPTSATREITDMYGNKVVVPNVITRVLSGGPVETQLIYILAPDKLCGLNGVDPTSFWNNSWDGTPAFIPSKYKAIPNIGNGSSGTLNFESAIATHPDIVLEGKTKNLATYKSKFGSIPVVGVNAGDSLLTDYEAEIKFVGDLLGVSDKANELLTYYKDAMKYVQSIIAPGGSAMADSAKVRVYYAEGNNGLQTDAQGSFHTNLLMYCGGYNVAAVTVQSTSQAVDVSQEQILKWNSEKAIDMIIIGRSSQASTYSLIMDKTAWWNTLNCVKNKQVYVRPDNPTSWFDGPPGYGQIIGLYWMVNLLYPEKTKSLDLNGKISEFYSKFLHYGLSQSEINTLLRQPVAP